MKKITIFVLGLACLTGANATGKLAAQQPAAAVQGGTRVVVVDINYVFANYIKVKLLKTEFESNCKPFNDRENDLKALMAEWQKAVANPALIKPAQVAQGKATIVKIERRLGDNRRHIEKTIRKQHDEQMAAIFKEVCEFAAAQAAKRGCHLIFGFSNPDGTVTPAIKNITPIMQAMNQGGLVPLYMAAGVDISKDVVNALNAGIAPSSSPIGGGTPAK